ncbi:putative toxin-antitoxin system toxin component, PIN family [Spirosoma sp. HMF4905]|uniref:Putative toxin-antitoxin system toxin component, PIN family n=1 Tax=Spirosoma arboris TaxID=2682092 RepID=A0A7K1SBC2_9BACT|nr:putative toxin-antitoxin system toxin component, PIN family [Spirosoma arboris]MVM31071.1 putative toxin-antitoxin system toxin component, PIN family [Spirosoma arboris]
MSSLLEYPQATSLKVVIDTNVLLVAISSRSPYHAIYQSFINELFTLCVTTDMLEEYEEILNQRLGVERTRYVLETIDNAPNTLPVTRYYRWELITVDPDDNKFVDCALACNADYIVTNDGHFGVLKTLPFPKVNIIPADELLSLIESINS